jgi:hypothetical protein
VNRSAIKKTGLKIVSKQGKSTAFVSIVQGSHPVLVVLAIHETASYHSPVPFTGF